MDRPPGKRPPARKRWGQNFLVDLNIIGKIVHTIAPRPDQRFVEIGPGHGELTLPIAEVAAQVTAVDIDPWLVEDLRDLAPDNVTIINEDILKVNFDALLDQECRAYGSLPYYITSEILFRMLDFRSRWQDMHILCQKEVAQRLAAGPGTKTYGRLSVMVQALADVDQLFNLAPDVFRPKPDVESAFVRLVPRTDTGIRNPRMFAHVVRLAFGQRRKKLSNALKSLQIADMLAKKNIHHLRAENVSIKDYIEIANSLAVTQQT